MITVETNFREQAKKKISDGKKEVKGNKEGAMKHAIADALSSFADQDNEFARAICEGGTFADCMKAVAKGVGNSISDIEAIRKAVDKANNDAGYIILVKRGLITIAVIAPICHNKKSPWTDKLIDDLSNVISTIKQQQADDDDNEQMTIAVVD